MIVSDRPLFGRAESHDSHAQRGLHAVPKVHESHEIGNFFSRVAHPPAAAPATDPQSAGAAMLRR
jgi:hypothetical protein